MQYTITCKSSAMSLNAWTIHLWIVLKSMPHTVGLEKTSWLSLLKELFTGWLVLPSLLFLYNTRRIMVWKNCVILMFRSLRSKQDGTKLDARTKEVASFLARRRNEALLIIGCYLQGHYELLVLATKIRCKMKRYIHSSLRKHSKLIYRQNWCQCRFTRYNIWC